MWAQLITMRLKPGEDTAAARAREQDPRRAELLTQARATMAAIFEGAPEFTDLEVIDEWTGA